LLFNSLPYFFLFAVTYIIYWNVPQRGKKLTIAIASILFYAYFSIPFLFHFISAVAVNYWISTILWEKKRKGEDTSLTIKLAVTANLINLGIFKYFYFVSDSIYFLTKNKAVSDFAGSWDIFLPLAISFYTFQLIALQVDIHRNIVKDKISFYDYFIFIFFFPQLIAGPIMRTDNFLPQLDNPTIDPDRMKKGLFLIIGGLFKKVVIAENVSTIISPLYMNPSGYDSYSLWLGMFGFLCQVYCDFSGYTDMARGSANLLGYEIPENFRGPYLSTSMKDLFTRWHVTLSTWLRDYIYIPLGGGKTSITRSNWNLILTNTLGGLWHGANINFVLWGFYLGVMISTERLLDRWIGHYKIFSIKFLIPIKILFVFCIFAFSGVLFRSASRGAESFSTAVQFFAGLFSYPVRGISLDRVDEIWTFLFLTILFNGFQYSSIFYDKLKRFQNIILPIVAIVMLLLLGIFGDGGKDFIYFQF
jgi:alginate O-acetyltransferase complex protein AlgI